MSTQDVKTVLIDDSDIDLFIQKRFLEVHNFTKELTLFKYVDEAFGYLGMVSEEDAPDIIFLDLNMPEKDGFMFLEHFKNLPQKIKNKSKIAVLTSSESLKDREQAFSFASVIQYISKPLKQKDLEVLKRLLA